MPPGSPAGETDVKPTSGETVSSVWLDVRKTNRRKARTITETGSHIRYFFGGIREKIFFDKVRRIFIRVRTR